MRFRVFLVYDGGSGSQSTIVWVGDDVHTPWGRLPLTPIWPGFLANTAFYAGVLALPVFALPALRRTRRRRKGLCPRCAYDLRETPDDHPCPECGTTPARKQSISPKG